MGRWKFVCTLLFPLLICHLAASQSTLQFEILDKETGELLPARLSFTKAGRMPDLRIARAPGLCPERNGVYTAAGRATITVPPGTYDVIASRGMEYSIDQKSLTLKAGAVSRVRFELRREVYTDGFIPCELHLHTSRGGGRLSPEEQAVLLAGEGILFAAVTDHQVIADLSTEIRALGLDTRIKTCRGAGYMSGNSHFTAFPLQPAVERIGAGIDVERTELGILKVDPTRPIIQAGHPRCGDLKQMSMNPVAPEVQDYHFIREADAIELQLPHEGSGSSTEKGNEFSSCVDWFSLLNGGLRITGVGSSETDGSEPTPFGMSRTYVLSSTPRPAEIDEQEIAQSIRMHRVAVARGVFVNMTAEGQPLGTEYTPSDGTVSLVIRARAPSWVQVDSLTVFGNGQAVWSARIPRRPKEPLEYEQTVILKPTADTWYVAKAEGKKSMSPMMSASRREVEVIPMGFTNPIWVDIDGLGFEPIADRKIELLPGREEIPLQGGE